MVEAEGHLGRLLSPTLLLNQRLLWKIAQDPQEGKQTERIICC